jgi:hypothetical protein
MSYEGSDRRVHRVFVTRNTEYHVRAELCVAVRDRGLGRWREDHPAVGRRLAGALKHVHGGIIPTLDRPEVGHSVYFRRGDRDLVTSVVERIERPAREVVAAYPRPLH